MEVTLIAMYVRHLVPGIPKGPGFQDSHSTFLNSRPGDDSASDSFQLSSLGKGSLRGGAPQESQEGDVGGGLTNGGGGGGVGMRAAALPPTTNSIPCRTGSAHPSGIQKGAVSM